MTDRRGRHHTGVPRAPQSLSRGARAWWNALQREYQLDDQAAKFLLEEALLCFDRVTAARKVIEVEGMTVEDRFHQTRPHPLLAAERDARSGMLAAFKALCLDIEPLRDGVGRPPGR